MPTKAEKEAAKAAKAAEKEAAKAATADVGRFVVFYRELTPSGERTGDNANRVFDNRKEAEAFAEKVSGKVK